MKLEGSPAHHTACSLPFALVPACALITLFTSVLLTYPDGCVDGCVVSGIGCTGWVSRQGECLQRSCEPATRLLLLFLAVFDSKASPWVCVA